LDAQSTGEIVKPLTRKERERLSRSRDIVEAARSIFAARGFAESTLEEIAERAEFGKGTIYSYFQSKEELFEAVMSDTLQQVLELTKNACLAEGESYKVKYLGFARSLLKNLFENRELYILIIRELHRPTRHDVATRMLSDILIMLEKPLIEEIERRRRTGIDTQRLAFVFLSELLSLFQTAIPEPDAHCWCHPHTTGIRPFESPDAAIAHLVNILEMSFFGGLQSVLGEPPSARAE